MATEMAAMSTRGSRAGIEQARPLRLNPSSCPNFVVRSICPPLIFVTFLIS